MNKQNTTDRIQILEEISKTRDVFTELDDFFRKFEGFRKNRRIREVITQRHEAAKNDACPHVNGEMKMKLGKL